MLFADLKVVVEMKVRTLAAAEKKGFNRKKRCLHSAPFCPSGEYILELQMRNKISNSITRFADSYMTPESAQQLFQDEAAI
jgi:hypothetical protein